MIDAQNRFLQNTGAAIKVEVIHEYPVPINNSVEECKLLFEEYFGIELI